MNARPDAPEGGMCECGHDATEHVLFSQMQRCEARVYSGLPFESKAGVWTCHCHQFVATETGWAHRELSKLPVAVGAGGLCGKHGVYVGYRCPRCERGVV